MSYNDEYEEDYDDRREREFEEMETAKYDAESKAELLKELYAEEQGKTKRFAELLKKCILGVTKESGKRYARALLKNVGATDEELKECGLQGFVSTASKKAAVPAKKTIKRPL